MDLAQQGKVTLNDEYFYSLTSLNSDYTTLNHKTVNANMGERELALYRIFFLLANYLVGYLAYPTRIIRSLKNIFLNGYSSTTVFEHRLRDRRNRAIIGATEPDNI